MNGLQIRKVVSYIYTRNMNQHIENSVGNGYEGNGWSKYQMLVLQQLNDHNSVLQNLNKETAELKQNIAVSEAEMKIWRLQITSDLKSVQEDLDVELYEDNGFNKRISTIEREMDAEDHHNTKNKATLALYGSIVMFVLSTIIQIVAVYFKVK